MNNKQFASGLVQLPTNNGGTNINTTSTTPTNSTSEIVLFPVSSSIDSKDYVYNGETILYVNSTTNSNLNTVKAQYFNPADTSNWNFEIQADNLLNGNMASSELLCDDISSFTNLQPANSKFTGKYLIDITNTGGSLTEFFSLTASPYASVNGSFESTPTFNNVIPRYSNWGSDNFLFTSNYFVKAKNEILIVYMIFTVTGTQSLNVLNSTSVVPTVSVRVINKVITKEKLSGHDRDSKTKVYDFGSTTLKYNDGATFDPKTSSFYLYNTMPVVLAPGFQKVYATIPLIYVPPAVVGNTYQGQYLNTTGYTIVSNTPVVTTTDVTTPANSATNFGYYVVGVSFSSDAMTYTPSTSICAEVILKNVWKSPIAIYNSYSNFSVNDMYNKVIVLLWGQSTSGGTFLVTNTGTPISAVKSYSVTTLGNFMRIMRVIINLYDGGSAYADYFTDENLINVVNTGTSYNIEPLEKHPVTDGMIENPKSVCTNPNMSYLFVNVKNSVGMTVDPTIQKVFNQNIGSNYLGLQGSVLCDTGNIKYNNSVMNMFPVKNGDVFANSLYLGRSQVGSSTYNMLLILPEAQFNAAPASATNNVMSIHSVTNSLIYVSALTIPTTGTQSEPNSAYEFSPDVSAVTYSKVNMSVSNAQLF